MLGKKFRIVLATLAIVSIPVCAIATPRAIISGSVTINKGDGNSVLPPKDVLENITDTSNNNNVGNSERVQKQGSLKIRLLDTKKKNSKEGVKFAISKVADIKNGEYKVIDTYSSVNIDLNKIKTASDLELAAELFRKVAVADNTMITNANGECSLGDLDIGVYLVYAESIAKYDNITPFIVSIPHWNEKDGMVYDLEVIPKHTEIVEKVISKVPPTAYDDNSIVNLALGGISLLGSSALFLGVRKNK